MSTGVCVLGLERYRKVTVRYVPRFRPHGTVYLRYDAGLKKYILLLLCIVLGYLILKGVLIIY